MADQPSPAPGPDLRLGYPADRLKDHEMLLGHVDGDPVLLVRHGALVHAVAATCTHYGASLADGLLAGDVVRCPLHHACFDVRTGQAIRAPALQPLACYEVERRLDLLVVRNRIEPPKPTAQAAYPKGRREPSRIVIIGAGAAGAAAALTLRREGFRGQLTLIGEEQDAPYDRPNLSKDYLAGTAGEEWLPLLPAAEFDDQGIRRTSGTPAARIDASSRTVWLMDGRAFPYEALLIATGATPVRLSLPGAGADRVHYLRTLDDCRKIIASADRADTAVIIGSGFIGLEAAASLRTRGLEVHIVSPDRVPLERVLGSTLGTRLQELHEAHGVVFHLGRTVTEITEQAVRLQDGSIIPAKLVLAAIGVQPNTGLASRAGLVLNRGIQVDRFLETSVTGVFAAGDVARWPDPRTGEAIRFEHWVTAERQGQTAARNMLGRGEAFEAIPFFWTQQYDQRINYSGHAPAWDRLDISAGLPPDQWEQRYYQGDELIAVATIGRDKVNLAAELELERGIGARRPGRASMGVTVPSGGVR